MSVANQIDVPMLRRQRSFIDKLRRGLFLPLLMLFLGLLLSVVASVFVALNQQHLSGQYVTVQRDIDTILSSMVDQETGLRGYITTNNELFLQPYDAGRPQYLTAVQQLKDVIQGYGFGNTATALSVVESSAANWYDTFAQTQINIMKSGNLALARSESINARGKALFDRFRTALTQLQVNANIDNANLQFLSNITTISVIGLIIVLSLVTIIFFWRTFNRLTTSFHGQLAILNETTTRFGSGDFHARVGGLNDVELDRFGQTFNRMADILQERQDALKDRDVLESVLQLNMVLTKSFNLDILAQEFLQHLLSLLDLQLGALYLQEQDGQRLRLFAAQGLYQRVLETEFQVGEGVVGRVAQSREAFYLAPKQEQSGETFYIKTLLGAVLPNSLYHIPLVAGEDVLGVLCVGSVYPMNENARNVLNVVSSNLANAISNTRAYQRVEEQADELTRRSLEQEQTNKALRRQRDDLRVLNIALEEANRARSQFLSTMSHELRTPLTSIIGFSQILLRGADITPLSHRQKSNIERILKNGQHLLSLINDVLDLAKIEAGRMDINYRQVHLQELLTTLVEETQSLIIERGLRLNMHVEPEVAMLETDPVKLRQIITNLLSNAVKFTEKGEIVITARQVTTAAIQGIAGTEGEKQVAISIQDTGIGIAKEQQEHIFEAFYQGDGSNTRKHGGTGLGLSIVYQLTTLLGGTLHVQSSPGQGSIFTLFLPVHARSTSVMQQNLRLHTLTSSERGRESRKTRQLEQPARTRRNDTSSDEYYVVLSVDDNPDILNMIDAALEGSSYRVVSVSDPTKVMRMIDELQPSAITLDVMMPDMNGWQLLHQLKSNPRTAKIPVIMLTVLEDRSTGYVLGADEYLIKPVERTALLSTLNRFTTRSSSVAVADRRIEGSADKKHS